MSNEELTGETWALVCLETMKFERKGRLPNDLAAFLAGAAELARGMCMHQQPAEVVARLEKQIAEAVAHIRDNCAKTSQAVADA